MFESEDHDEKRAVCPLKRVKLSHTLPLCLFIMINFCLVIGTLLITGVCRLAATVMDWSKKRPKEVERNLSYDTTIRNPDISAFTFLAVAAFAFFVTICYGPDWMRTAFQICTTIGFFASISMTLFGKNDFRRVMLPPSTPSTPTTPTTPTSVDI